MAAVTQVTLAVGPFACLPVGVTVIAQQTGDIRIGLEQNVASPPTRTACWLPFGLALPLLESGDPGATIAATDLDTNRVDEGGHQRSTPSGTEGAGFRLRER